MEIDKISVGLIVGIIVCATFAFVLPAMAGDNDATQQATVSKVTTIKIMNQNDTITVSAITFPEGAGGANIDTPSNGVDATAQDPNNASRPVVRLENPELNGFNIYYNITAFTNNAVSNEYYKLTATTANASTGITGALTLDGSQHSLGETLTASETKNLYLKVLLNVAGAGKASGESTITILGEAI